MAGINRPIRVMMLGFRGFPCVQGGVETHVEHLCPLLVQMGCDVTVLVRSPYQPTKVGKEWKGVKFVSLWAPKSKALEAILHSFLGVLYAVIHRPDILHIQAIGPALMTPLARIMGLLVVVTNHGPDYERQKWGRFARFVLQLGERWGMCWSNERIAISAVIADLIYSKHHMESRLIPNGVELPILLYSLNVLEMFNLVQGRYVLLVSRLVPEKRHFDLIEAFIEAQLNGWNLVLVGDADHPDNYVQTLLLKAKHTPNVVVTGFQSGDALRELYAHAGLFVLPSSHEGLPIALLEALSYGLPVLASDIPANLEVGLPAEHYFPLGNIEVLADRIRVLSRESIILEARENTRAWVSQHYDWRDIAEKTLKLYVRCLGRNQA